MRRTALLPARAHVLAARLALGLALGFVMTASAAQAEEPPPAIRALDSADAAARAAAEAALRELDGRDELVAAVLRDPEAFGTLGPAARETLVGLAGEVELAYVNGSLRRIVRDDREAPGVRRAAVVVLGERGGVADVVALGSALEPFPNEAARALAAIGGRSATAVLRKHWERGADAAVGAALVKLGDPRPLSALAILLRDDDGARRERAGLLLTWATGRELPPEPAAWDTYVRRRGLADQLGQEDLERAQNAVQELAGVLRSRSSANLESDLAAVLADASWPLYARNGAALTLGLGDARGAQDVLLAATRNLEEGSVRLYAAEALARMGDLSVAVPFADMLVHDEDRDRIKARRRSTGEFFPVDPGLARALLRLGCRGAVEPMLELLAGDYRTRMHRDTLRCLREATGGEDFGFEPDAAMEDRRAAVARARAWWAQGREKMVLAARADDPGRSVFRKQVDERIAKLGAFKFLHQLRAKKALIIVAEPALPQLLAALSDEDLHVRMGVAEVLRGAGLRTAGPALAARLRVEESPVARSKFVWALERCGRRDDSGQVPPGVRDAVRRALGDEELEVRIVAARTLGAVGDPAADVVVLRAARENAAQPQENVQAFRAATAGALLLLGDDEGFDDLAVELLCDDVARRADAADVLRRAGVALEGYDPDDAEERRAAAVTRVRRVLEGER